MPGGTQHSRLGLAIAKKQARRAVDRNRLKRIVRETFREEQSRLANLDLVVMVRATAVTTDHHQLMESLLGHFDRLTEQHRSAHTDTLDDQPVG